jgi:hypothetical protein
VNPDDLARILDELGQRLGPAGAYVFGLAVRQVLIGSVLGLSLAVVTGASGYVALRATRKHVAAEWARWNALPEREKDYPHTNGRPDTLGGALWWYLLPGALFIATALIATFALSRLLNPEYAALTDILSRIVPQ